MISEMEVRERLASLLVDEISLPDFEDWLVGRSWNMHKDSEETAQDLVWSIESALFAYSSDHLNEDQLRAQFAGLLNNARVVVRLVPAAKQPFYHFDPPPRTSFSGTLVSA